MLSEQQFAQIVKDAGGTAYRVGGSIRNLLLSIPVNDNDYCVTGLTPAKIESLFPEIKHVGKDFPVFLLDIEGELCEVALARTERKTGAGHTGFEVNFNPDIMIEEDLSRRDFTMNAIAYDIISQKIIDPFDGRVDIHDKVIRAISESFTEDPLRVYRAARFSAQLGFRVHPYTTNLFLDYGLQNDMKTLSVERIYEELKKALKSPRPEKFFDVLRDGNCLHIHFKEIADLIGVEQHPEHHPEGDVYNHTMQVLARMSEQTDKVERRFAALCHDIGKARTPREEWPRHHAHDTGGIDPLHELCDRLKLPIKWRHTAHHGVVYHMRFHRINEMRDIKKVDMIEAARKSTLGVEGLAQLGLADARGRNDKNQDHPNYELFLYWADLISAVKGNKELEGKKAWDDKRKRQAALIKHSVENVNGQQQ